MSVFTESMEGKNSAGYFSAVSEARRGAYALESASVDYADEAREAQAQERARTMMAVYADFAHEFMNKRATVKVSQWQAEQHLRRYFKDAETVAQQYGVCSVEVMREFAYESDEVVQGFVTLCVVAGMHSQKESVQ